MPARFSFAALSFAWIAFVGGCSNDGPTRVRPDGGNPLVDGGFVCVSAEAEACLGDVHFSCEADGEFLRPVRDDCAAQQKVCVPELWCVVCRPDEVACRDGNTAVCRSDGSGWDILEECDVSAGLACRNGRCRNLCELAIEDRSYLGCEFYAVDLDNAALGVGRDASAQTYALVVSNPGREPTRVVVEVNDAPQGSAPVPREIDARTIPPGDLEVFELPRREVDGSSSNTVCTPTDRTCPGAEVCVCSRMDTEPPCSCRVSATSSGRNDGTHTALTSNAYRVRSQLPIVAYQFNPLENVSVFSNDASLLLPTSALERRYSVVTWPQTIAHSPSMPSNPDVDFDNDRDDEDLRTFLTIVGTGANTTVHVQLGGQVVRVHGAGSIPELGPSGALDLRIGPFDVVNLETQGLNADFTGSTIEASQPVAVFVGSEASDVPRFDTYVTRQCCADHLEEQLFPDVSLGQSFMIARGARRSVALNHAFVNPLTDQVAEPNEPEWVRVLSAADRSIDLATTLPPPDDRFTIAARQSVIIRADQDFLLNANGPVSVLEAQASQEATGIGSQYPGGDPAIVLVPPIEQFRRDYVFLTPDKYAFDFFTVMAEASTQVLLDGEPLRVFDEGFPPVEIPRKPYCTVSPADGIERRPGDPPPELVIYRCQLSFPDVVGASPQPIEDGDQYDGVHTVVADRPIGLVVYGFDAFVSYAYVGGLNLEIIN